MAERIAEIADRTRDIAEAGGLAVNDSLEGMERLKRKGETMSERIAALSKNSRQISEISDITEDIADKTHVLALNAAIESASAGEHGRRFAVVASQVRELAEEAKNSTRQVRYMASKFIRQQTRS